MLAHERHAPIADWYGPRAVRRLCTAHPHRLSNDRIIDQRSEKGDHQSLAAGDRDPSVLECGTSALILICLCSSWGARILYQSSIGIDFAAFSRYSLLTTQAATGKTDKEAESTMTQKESLFTLGYSGHDLKSFLERLQRYKVKVVIDVRRTPLSRKKGFSRTALSGFLAAHDVDYRHEVELGVPNELRDKLKAGRLKLENYFEQFELYLANHVDVLDRVYSLATSQRCCLLCMESFPQDCHRSIVAKAIEARNGHKLQVMHV